MDSDKLYTFLENIGVDVRRESNGNIFALCPFHSENKPSWGISTSEPHPHGCFACGASGYLYDLLVRVGHYTPTEAKRTCQINETNHDFIVFEDKPIKDNTIPEEKLYPYCLEKRGARYVVKRGIPLRIAKKLGLVYMPLTKRVLFPWYNDKRLVGVTGRLVIDVDDDEIPKMLPLFGSQKSRTLYLPGRSIRKGKFYLVEGEVDAAKVFASGFKNTGAIGHGKFSKGQKHQLLESDAAEIVCFFDDDKVGRRLTDETMEFFSGKKRVSCVSYKHFREKYWYAPNKVKPKLDPGFLKRVEIRYAFRKCIISNANWPSF